MKERYLKYAKICERAEKMNISTGERVSAMMDVESADKKFNMRLDDWLMRMISILHMIIAVFKTT